MSNPPQLPPNGAPPKKRGCFFYGCLTLFVIVLLGAVVVYFTYRYVVNTVNDATDTKPIPMETVEVTAAELDAIHQRLETFGDALNRQDRAEEFYLTAREINALIAESGDLKDKLFVIIEGGKIKGKISYQLPNDLGPLKVKGRYLNGLATFHVALTNGQAVLNLQSLEVKGRPLPAAIFNELRKQNLAEGFQKEPQISTNLAKIDTFTVQDDKILIRNKVKP